MDKRMSETTWEKENAALFMDSCTNTNRQFS